MLGPGGRKWGANTPAWKWETRLASAGGAGGRQTRVVTSARNAAFLQLGLLADSDAAAALGAIGRFVTTVCRA